MELTAIPFSLNASRPRRNSNVTPSSVALAMLALVTLSGVIPKRTPLPSGRSGTRSPLKNGRSIRPSEPTGADSAASSNSFTPCSIIVLIVSDATVQFIVHRRGSHVSWDEQNDASLFSLSWKGCEAEAKSVPDVPRLMVTRPSETAPVPIALIILSPPPEATAVLSGSPSSSAAFTVRCPMIPGF